MLSLRFEDVPSGSIAIGETYNVAIILENDEGEPMTELEGVQVKLSVEAPQAEQQSAVAAYVEAGGITGISDVVDISCGEGIIELVFAKPAPCSTLILKGTVVDGSCSDEVRQVTAEISGIPSNAGGRDAAAVDQQDEDLSDIGQIVARLRAAMNQSTHENVGPKVKHYLMLIKGRMWNAEGNSERLLAAGLVPMLLELLATAPLNGGASVEAVLEALNVLEELLVNKFAEVMPSCSSCRALIRPDNTMEVLSAKDMGTYHASCLRCRTCNESVHTQPFVRDTASMAPHHVDCAKKANVANDGVVIQCTVVVKPAHITADHHVAAKHFWSSDQVNMLISTLKSRWLPVNEYVRDRAARVALRVGKAEVGPQDRRELFIAGLVGK